MTLLHAFTGGDDGGYPLGGVVRGSNGSLYGTTALGVAHGQGAVCSATLTGNLTTLHAFAGTGDGAQPQAALILASDGTFYGTTSYGSVNPQTYVTSGKGTIFKMTPAGVMTTLHTFASDGSEGNTPTAALLQASDGTFYGTTSAGGTVFSITPGGTFTTLYTFGAQAGGGSTPVSALIQGTDGNLYGATELGGTDDCVVYKVNVPTLHPAFFDGETALANGVYYLAFATGNPFGYYSFLTDPRYIYHFDLGYEYVFDAADGYSGVYLYDFKSDDFFYTSPAFPYLFDFGLNTVLYYYPDPNNAGHYNTDGYRFFYRFDTGQIIVK